MSVDGQDSEPTGVTTGLPQGPRSPVPFAIYIADTHQAVEDQVKDSRDISFVDDVALVVGGTSLDDAVNKLERYADTNLRWANDTGRDGTNIG